MRECVRTTGLILSLFCVVLFNSCVEEELPCKINGKEQTYEPNEITNALLTESIVERGTLHLAFPTITGTSDGSKLLIAYREAKTHISFDGRIVQKESYDKGKTWINRRVIYQPTHATGDARDPQFLLLPDGRVICRFFERTSEQHSSVKMIISADWGQTYSSYADLPAHSSGETYAAARGNMLLQGDTIYTSMYNRWHDSWLMRSTDLGKTWAFSSWLNRSDKTMYGVHRQLNESSLCMQDGVMYMVARGGYEEPLPMTVAQSLDGGASWENWADLGVSGHSPSLRAYGDNYIITYRNVDKGKNGGNVRFDCALFNQGKLIAKPYSILTSKSTDIGYGDVFTFDTFFLVCCYTDKTIHCFRVLYDVFNS